MSSDHQTFVKALDSNFENHFTDINRLLDNVITKNGRNPTITITQHISETSKISQSDDLKKSGFEYDHLPHAKAVGYELFDKSNLQDLVRQSGLSRESELNTTSNTFRHSQAETSYVTPVKSKNAPSSGSTAEAHRYGTPSQDGDAYDYTGAVFSSPQVEIKRSEEISKTPVQSVPSEVEKYILPVVKRDLNTTKLVDETLKHLNRDMHFSRKYAPEEVLRSIEKTGDGKFYLVDSLKPDQKILKESVKNHPQYKQDPIDQIVILASPEREIGNDEKILSVYQQVSEVYNDDTSYIGEKFLGLRQGQGTYYFQDGYRYEGTWEDDQMSGFGILWIDDVKWYEGEWKDNTFHGKGIVYNLTPEAPEPGKVLMNDFNQVGNAWDNYEGKFSKGRKHGFGTITFTNGDSFTGKFEEDNIHGRGSYATADRKKISPGMWENNVLKRLF